jgi:hypothetical protein
MGHTTTTTATKKEWEERCNEIFVCVRDKHFEATPRDFVQACISGVLWTTEHAIVQTIHLQFRIYPFHKIMSSWDWRARRSQGRSFVRYVMTSTRYGAPQHRRVCQEYSAAVWTKRIRAEPFGTVTSTHTSRPDRNGIDRTASVHTYVIDAHDDNGMHTNMKRAATIIMKINFTFYYCLHWFISS